MSFIDDQGEPSIESDKRLSHDQMAIIYSRVVPGILDDERNIWLKDGMGAESRASWYVSDLDAICRLEPETIFVNQRDEGYGCIANQCCQRSDVVEIIFVRGIEYLIAMQYNQSSALIFRSKQLDGLRGR